MYLFILFYRIVQIEEKSTAPMLTHLWSCICLIYLEGLVVNQTQNQLLVCPGKTPSAIIILHTQNVQNIMI